MIKKKASDLIKTILLDDRTVFRILYACIVILVVLSAFTVCHIDLSYWNMTWGKTFLECIHSGKLRYFAIALEEKGTPTNYSFLMNLSFSFWIIPIYIIEVLIGKTISYYVYAAWYKVFIIIITLLTVKSFKEVIFKLYGDKNKSEVSAVLYLLSSMVLLGSIADGQVDFLGMYFFMKGMLCFVNKEYVKMSLFSSLAIIVKGFAIMFYFPVILLLFGNDLLKVIKHIIIVFIPTILDKIFTLLFFVDYARIRSDLYERIKYDFVGRLFQFSIFRTSLFLFICVVVCVICYYLSVTGKVEKSYYPFFGSLIFVSFLIIVDCHPNWFFYCIPCMIIMGFSFVSSEVFLLLYFGINMMYMLLMTSITGLKIDNLMIKNSLLAAFIDVDYEFWFLHHFYEMVFTTKCTYIFATVLSGLMFAVLLIYAYESGKRIVSGKKLTISAVENRAFNNFLLIANALPMGLYFAATYIIFIHAVMINSR